MPAGVSSGYRAELRREKTRAPSKDPENTKCPHETISTPPRPLQRMATSSEALIHDQTSVIVTQIQ